MLEIAPVVFSVNNTIDQSLVSNILRNMFLYSTENHHEGLKAAYGE